MVYSEDIMGVYGDYKKRMNMTTGNIFNNVMLFYILGMRNLDAVKRD